MRARRALRALSAWWLPRAWRKSATAFRYSSRLQPSLCLPAPAPSSGPEASRGHAFPVARWLETGYAGPPLLLLTGLGQKV
eukprot:2308842-Prymnesium_polylepis.1